MRTWIKVLILAGTVFALIYVMWPSLFKITDEGLNPAKISQEVSRGQAVLLDVRTSEELSTDGYAVDSTHFDLARLQNGELPDYPKDMKIYAYCKGGVRAGKAKDILEENGFTNVINIGGLVDWENAGGEVIK